MGQIKVARLLGVLVLVAGLWGCGGGAAPTSLYREVGRWLATNALPDEVVALQEPEALQGMTSQPLMALPLEGGASAVLAALQEARPAYCLAARSVTWEGVQADPWFGEHYRQVAVSADAQVSFSPLVLYRYTPSPFDDGALVTLAATRRVPEVGHVTVEALQLSHPRRIWPGEPFYLTVTLRGEVRESLRAVLMLRALVDGRIWLRETREQPGGLPTEAWSGEQSLTDRYHLVPPAGLPPGAYALELVWLRPNDAPFGEAVTLAQLTRPAEVSQVAPSPDHAAPATFGDAIALLGYDAPLQASPGTTITVTLYWRALASAPGDYKVFVHAFAADGTLVAQHDGQPANWAYPTTAWQAGDIILDRHPLALAANLPPGEYRLFVGLYEAAAPATRLPVRDAEGALQPDGHLGLAVLRVR